MTSRPLRSAEQPRRGGARDALIDAAHVLVRRNGWAATSVDDLCRNAGATKGAFFHHFPSKDALGVAAAERWTDRARDLIFENPKLTKIGDPLQRVLAHIDLRLGLMDGPAEGFTCFVGTMVQESFASSDTLRAAAENSLTAYAKRLAEDIQEALDHYGPVAGVDALGLAFHVQAVLQGAFILAKAQGDPSQARGSVAHLKQYVRMLFNQGECK